MHERAHRAALSIVPSLLGLLLVVACAAPSASAPAASATAPAVAAPDAPMACYGFGFDDCAKAASVAVRTLASVHPVRYIQVGPFGCPGDVGCPDTLAGRPEGDVILDLADGTQVSVHITAQPDGSMTAVRGEWFAMPVEPSSGPAGPGRIPFTFGHCGISSGIDVDGSFWDPVGIIDLEAPGAGDGFVTLSDPDHATFSSKDGTWSFELIRHEGTKLLPGCM
jgi:hypothetical protein